MKIDVTALYGCGKCIAPEDWHPLALPRPYRLYYVVGGEAYFSIGGNKTPLTPGNFYLFPSSLPFNVHQSSDCRLDHLYYDFMMKPAVISREPLCCAADAHDLMPPLLKLMEQSVCAFRYDDKAELKDTVIRTLEAFLSVFLEIALPKTAFDADIMRAVEFIENSYTEDISVGELAELVHLDEDHFIRKFKRALGITPYAYIRNLRLAVAKELRYGGASLKDAACAVGFKHPSSYCRAIRKKDG